MPLAKGTSKKVIAKNVKELVKSKPSKTRAKAVATIAKKQGVTKKVAKVKQAVAIAYAKAGKSKPAAKPVKKTVKK